MEYAFVSKKDASAIEHHGILGMHWGERNGPPYPLDFSKLSDEERAKAKTESIQRGDIRTAKYNSSYYSIKEMQDLISRFDQNRKLSELNSVDINKGWEAANNAMKNAGAVIDFGAKLLTGYNIIANVVNTIDSNEPMPVVGKKK